MKRTDHEERSRQLHEAAWPDMFANLQSAYAELTRAQFALEQRTAEIEETRDLFQRVIESMSEALFMMDRAGRVIQANPAAGALLESTEAELLDRPFAEVCGTDEVPATPWRLLERAPGGSLINLDVEVHTKSGRAVQVSVSCGLVRDKRGKITGVLAVARDITERKRLEEALRHRAQELVEANRLKDEFLATVSHELRTPLTAITGWLFLLRAGQLDEAASAKALETIERNAQAQSQLVEDLLDVSRIISGKLRLETRLIELAPIVEAAINTARPAADAKFIHLELVLGSKVGLVSGDPDRLQQVIWNLLSNAIKFTPDRGRVEVRLEHSDTQAAIIVRDTGQGIAPEFLPYVFERFRQADGSSTRSHGGLGLGLSIVRHLVELHGGTVRVESEGLGQGATFTVMLPLATVASEMNGAERRQPAIAEGIAPEQLPLLNGLRVLVVEDEQDTRQMLTMILKQHEADVTAVGSVAEALEALERVQPDALISDIEMPGEDGYELISKVRARELERGAPRIPAIALTAYARSEDRMRALLAGYQIHLAKPVVPVELLALIASLVGRTGKS